MDAIKILSSVSILLLGVSCVYCMGPVDNCANSTVSVENCLNTQGIDREYIEAFAPACTKHDVCYKCGARFHKDREKCDVIFLDELSEICKSMKGKTYKVAACDGVAGTYYSLIYMSGDFMYYEESQSFCKDFWVAMCLA